MTVQTATVAGAAAGTLQLSPNGSSALISNGGQMQVIGGLPASPAVVSFTDASYLGAASALAVSDDGQWVAGVFGGALYALGSGGQVIALPAPAGVAATAFFHGTDDLAVTTAVQVLEISNIAGTPTTTVIHGSADTPPPPESPISRADLGKRVDRAGRAGWRDWGVLATGAVSIASCGCTPQGLIGLGGDLFRVSSLANGSVKVYDASSGMCGSCHWRTPARKEASSDHPPRCRSH